MNPKILILLAAAGLPAATAPHLSAAPGDITTFAGNGGTGANGEGIPATDAIVNFVRSLAVDSDGNVYFLTSGRAVYRVERSGGLVDRYAGIHTSGDSGDGGPALAAAFMDTQGLAVGPGGILYIADKGAHRIRRVDPKTGLVSTLAGTGTPGPSGDGGPAAAAQLNSPTRLAADHLGSVYVVDDYGSRVRKIDGATGVITTVAGDGSVGDGGDGGPATDAAFNTIRGICVGRNLDLYLTDSANHRIRRVDAATGLVDTVAGNGLVGPVVEGIDALSARFYYPFSVSVDHRGNLFIADQAHFCVRRVDAVTRLITTVAGTTVSGYSGDGGPAGQAMIASTQELALDRDGHLYLADTNNRRIRRVESATAPVEFQPDNAIGKSLRSLRGAGIQNRNALGQTESVRGRRRAAFAFTVGDDTGSLFSDSRTVRASRGDRRVRVVYFRQGSSNVTAGLVAGTLATPPLAGNDRVAFLGKVSAGPSRRGRSAGRSKRKPRPLQGSFTVVSRSVSSPAGLDVVRALATVRP